MPTVPQYQRQSQTQMAPVNTQDLRIPRDNGLGALAEVGQNALGLYQHEQQKVDLADMQDKINQFTQFADDQYNNTQNGLITLQGKNAIGQGDQRAQLLSTKAAELRDSLPEYMRQSFDQQIVPLGRSYGNRYRQYEVGQRQQFEAGQQQGLLSNYFTQANDPAQFRAAALSARQAIIDYGSVHGQSSEEIEANWQQWYQGAANSAFDTAYSQMYQNSMGPGGKLPVTSGSNSDQLFSAMIWNESRGNQFGKDGTPLISPKGAVGIAQVTESTGPEAAKLAGLAWDKDKWLNDPRYNATIGHAYFQSQMKRFNDNPVLAVAAYNAGHGQVNKWIEKFGDPRKGEISAAEFAEKIPFDETRNYVAKVVGAAPGIPTNSSITEIMKAPYWQAMNPKNKSAAMAKIAGLYDMQASAGRVALQGRMQDDLVKLESGKAVTPISADEWAAVMPMQAAPAERMRMEKTFQQYQQAMTLQPVYQTIMQGNVQEGTAAVQSMAPKESGPDFKYKSELYASAQAKLGQVLKAREADPGTWLQQNSPVVQSALQQYQNDPSSGEYLVSRIQAEKDRFGIVSKKVLPNSMVNAVLQRIDNTQESSVTTIQSVAQSFGKYSDQVMQQVQKSAYPALQVVMATENPRAANAIWQNRGVKTSDLRGSFEKPDADSADSSWNDQAKGFASTMIVQPGGTAVWNNFNEQGKRLTYINMQRGMSASDAAKQAYQDILGEQYQTNGTWRLPNRTGLDLRDVSDGASTYLDSLTANKIMPLVGDPRLSDEVNRNQSISRIKDSAQWVTNNDETGLTLMLNGLIVNGEDGSPITVPFGDLAKLGAANRSGWNSITKFFGSPVKYTPGQSKKYSLESQRDDLVNIFQSGQQSGR